MQVAVLLGSIRAKSNTAKVMATAVAALQAHAGVKIDVLDPRAMPLSLPGAEGDGGTLTVELQQRVRAADAVVMVTPEYDGSYSATIKVLIEHLGYPSVLMGKPVALIGVATGFIGADRALEHLRAVCVHIGALVLPGMVSFGLVHKEYDKNEEQAVASAMAALVSFSRQRARTRPSS